MGSEQLGGGSKYFGRELDLAGLRGAPHLHRHTYATCDFGDGEALAHSELGESGCDRGRGPSFALPAWALWMHP